MSEQAKPVKPNQETDPYGYYQYMRDHEPVAQMEGGPWQVTRHEDVHRILKDHGTFSSDVSMRPEEERQPSMLFSDPPFHNRMRKLVSYAFKPRFVESQRSLIEARSEELVVEMSQHHELAPSMCFANSQLKRRGRNQLFSKRFLSSKTFLSIFISSIYFTLGWYNNFLITWKTNAFRMIASFFACA